MVDKKKSSKKKSTKKKTTKKALTKTGKPKHPGHAWNKVVFDDVMWDKFDALLQFQPSLTCCEELLGISHDIIEREIRENFDCTFAQYRDRKMGRIRIKLKQKCIAKALEGDNSMLIWTTKNLCGWADRNEESENSDVSLTLNYKI